MATTYPSSIDSFSNPVSTKVNGQDYVKAEHINDIQDAVRAMQISLVGSGVSVNFGSNYFVPASASFKTAVETLDSALETVRADGDTHRTLSMITDAAQHHANVIEFSSGSGAVLADISPMRVQTALEVVRQEINLMLAGGTVRGSSLNNLYILKSGPAVVTGTMEVQDDFQTNGNNQLGQTLSHTTITAGDLNVGKDLDVLGTSNFHDDIKLDDSSKLGLEGQLAYSYLTFSSTETRLQSLNDIILKLDANGLVDGLNQLASFQLLDAVNQVAFSVNELGAAVLQTSLTTGEGFFTSKIDVGNSSKLEITNNSIDTDESNLRILLDKSSTGVDSKLTVSKDGYLGDSPANSNVMMQATETEFYSGRSVLLPSLTETGTVAFKFFSNNPSGEFQGNFVRFRQKKTGIPSVNFTINNANSVNVGTVQVGLTNEDGFYIECDSLAVGMVYLEGTFEA